VGQDWYNAVWEGEGIIGIYALLILAAACHCLLQLDTPFAQSKPESGRL
jgi:hypothetical protein